MSAFIRLRPRGHAVTAIVAAVSAVLATIGTVWASHNFNDVPSNHPFHAEISAVADAGIARGFGDGGYHPSDVVTRQAMAAFLERGLGRVALNSGDISLVANQTAVVTGVAVDAGAAGAGNGFVLLQGTVSATIAIPAQCPCRLNIAIRDQIANEILADIDFDVDNVASESATATAAGTVQAAAPIAANATGRYSLRVDLVDANVSEVLITGTLSAIYVPFGPDGDNTLLHCPDQEGEPNNSIAAAEPLVSPMMGCIEPAGDHDFFSIVVPGGHRLYASSSGIGDPNTCDMDTIIRIRNSAGTQIAIDDDSGPGPCSAVATGQQGLTAGTYFVEVEAWNPVATGAYMLTALTAPATSSTSATPPGAAPPEEGDKD